MKKRKNEKKKPLWRSDVDSEITLPNPYLGSISGTIFSVDNPDIRVNNLTAQYHNIELHQCVLPNVDWNIHYLPKAKKRRYKMILFKVDNHGIPLYWKTFTTENSIRQEVISRGGKGVTPDQFNFVALKGICQVASNMWILREEHEQNDVYQDDE